MNYKQAIIDELLLRLNNKLSSKDIVTVRNEVDSILSEYDIAKSEHALAVQDKTVDIVKTYLIARKIEGLSEGTLKQYGRTIRIFFGMVQKPLEDITTNDIRMFLYQQSKTMSERSMENQRLYLRAFFQWCEDSDYIRKNPAKIIKPIKYEKRVREPLTDIEEEKMRQACVTKREKAIFETLLATGCRVSELVHLKKSDVNFETRDVTLFGKGKKARKSYLNAKAEIALKEYLAERKDDSDYLFVANIRPYDGLVKETVEQEIENIANRANLKQVFPHRIRHTMATKAIKSGMPIEHLRMLLGHESIDTTLIYAKTSEDSVKHSHAKYVI